MTRNWVRLGIGIVATALVVGTGAGSVAAGERTAHLSAHGKVVWVMTDSASGEILWTRAGTVHVTARDTDPNSLPCTIPSCPVSTDKIAASIDDGLEATEGSFEANPALPGHSTVYLPGGVDLLFVDRGEPGATPVGPQKGPGVAESRDYVQWLNASPSVTLKGYFVTGNVQFNGARVH